GLHLAPGPPVAVLVEHDAGAIELAGGLAFIGHHPLAAGSHDLGHVAAVLLIADEQGWDLLHGHAPVGVVVVVVFVSPVAAAASWSMRQVGQVSPSQP